MKIFLDIIGFALSKRIARYCSCGASFSLRLQNCPPEITKTLLGLWKERHSGPGHEECDAKTARIARNKAEAEAAREEKPYSGLPLLKRILTMHASMAEPRGESVDLASTFSVTKPTTTGPSVR